MIDLSRLRSIVGDDKETERTLLGLYLETANKVLNDLQGGIGNWQELVHELKGASANMGVEHLHIACKNAEKEEPQGEARQALFDQIKRVIIEVESLIA